MRLDDPIDFGWAQPIIGNSRAHIVSGLYGLFAVYFAFRGIIWDWYPAKIWYWTVAAILIFIGIGFERKRAWSRELTILILGLSIFSLLCLLGWTLCVVVMGFGGILTLVIMGGFFLGVLYLTIRITRRLVQTSFASEFSGWSIRSWLTWRVHENRFLVLYIGVLFAHWLVFADAVSVAIPRYPFYLDAWPRMEALYLLSARPFLAGILLMLISLWAYLMAAHRQRNIMAIVRTTAIIIVPGLTLIGAIPRLFDVQPTTRHVGLSSWFVNATHFQAYYDKKVHRLERGF